MDQNALIQVAFSLYNNKGAYALLLGSGISRAAGIPTGWEITTDMISQLAGMYGEDCSANPEGWYKKKFGSDAGYSKLLDQLGKTPTERHNFLKPYFEPSEDERAENRKQLTKAHRAIAKLVADGIIRVIITTNFDRLLERAIEDEGIVPNVISSPDAVEGATPIVHSKCTIIKVNGDYLDTRAKNTIDELDSYDDKLNQLLDRVFDEFGLIVCGWSGDWDTGLRAALERVKGKRFACYWCVKAKPSELSAKLMQFRSAVQIQINDADSFFESLEDKLNSLAELNRPHPLSAQLAVASLKRYIVEEKYRIRLHDLVMDEVNRVAAGLNGQRYPFESHAVGGEDLQRRIEQYFADLDVLLPLLANGCYWGKQEHDELWLKALDRIANAHPDGGGKVVFISLRLLPASILLYGMGIMCIHSGKFGLLHKLLSVRVQGFSRSSATLEKLYLFKVLEQNVAKTLPARDRERTPLHNLIFEKLQAFFSEIIPSAEFELAFDRLEYFWSLIHVHDVKRMSLENADEAWSPPARFSWKSCYDDHVSKVLERELAEQGENWKPLKDGLFSGKADEAKRLMSLVNNFTERLGWRW